MSDSPVDHSFDADDEPVGYLGAPPLRTELPAPPFFLVAGFLILVVGTWVPLVFFARGRFIHSEAPRIHIVQDMGSQTKYKAQAQTDIFPDERAMRMPIEGTVARGHLNADDHLERGFVAISNGQAAPGTELVAGADAAAFFTTLPPQIPLNDATLARGQQRFNIYCAVCHGTDGYGNGAVNARAIEKQESKWVQPANLHSDSVRGRPIGHLFNTATNGIRNMAGYGSQISTEDRWAIVAYVRALQTSQHVPAGSLPAEVVQQLK